MTMLKKSSGEVSPHPAHYKCSNRGSNRGKPARSASKHSSERQNHLNAPERIEVTELLENRPGRMVYRDIFDFCIL